MLIRFAFISKLEEFVWRESLHFFTKVHPDELKPLSQLERTKLNALLSDMFFKRVKKGAKLDVSNGAVFLRGLECPLKSTPYVLSIRPSYH